MDRITSMAAEIVRERKEKENKAQHKAMEEQNKARHKAMEEQNKAQHKAMEEQQLKESEEQPSKLRLALEQMENRIKLPDWETMIRKANQTRSSLDIVRQALDRLGTVSNRVVGTPYYRTYDVFKGKLSDVEYRLDHGGAVMTSDELEMIFAMDKWIATLHVERERPQKAEEDQIEEVLAERGKRYGDFRTHAAISQRLKTAMYGAGSYELPPLHREALEMIAHKIARILNGDPNYKDSWVDIAGYAQLVAKELED